MTVRQPKKKSDPWALLGLARRAGAVQVGVERAREALRLGEATLIVVAADAAPGQRRKVEALALAREVPILIGPEREELGRMLGVSELSAVALTDSRFAERLSERTL